MTKPVSYPAFFGNSLIPDFLGFPPADSQVRNFLCPDDQSYNDSLRAAHAFLFALFQVATRYFQNIDKYLVGIPPSTSLAQKFRGLMNTFHLCHAFYSDVISKAREVQLLYHLSVAIHSFRQCQKKNDMTLASN